MTWCYGYLVLLINIDININMVLVQYLFLQPYGCSFPDWLVWLVLRDVIVDARRGEDFPNSTEDLITGMLRFRVQACFASESTGVRWI